MNLRNRSLLVLGLTFFVFFIIIAAVSLSVTLQGLDRIEYEDMGASMKQVQSALNTEDASLLSTTQDWAWWDDMYRYATDQNPEFLASNTQPEALATLNLNLFMILDEKGNILHCQVLSPDFQTSGSVPADLETFIQNNSRIVYHTEDDPGVSGILLTPEGPMVVASVPILRSDRTGPVHGTLIMGRYLDFGPLRRINDMTGFNVAFDWQGTEVSGTGLPAGPDSLPGKYKLILVADNETTITGYSTVQDLAGKDVVVGVTKDRQLYRIGLANITTYLVILALWAIMTGLIVVIIMDRMVLKRMGVLTEHVRSLSGNREGVPGPVLSGNDELAGLEKTIIASRRDLLLSEQQLRVFVNAMPGPAALFSREGRVLLANPAFAGYLDKPVEEIVGADIRSCMPVKDIENYDRFVKEAIRKKEAVHFENELEGKTLFMSFYPVLGSDGEVIQLGLLVFDISERKQIEEALRDSQARLAEAMDLAHLVHWEFDVSTGIFTFNDRFYAMYGTTAEREGGYRMPAEVYAREFVHPDDANLVAEEVKNAIAATGPAYTRQVEHRIVRRDGEIRYIIVRIAITKDAEGRTVKTHGANQDITERKQAEELRRHFTEELEQQVRSRTQELETLLNEKVVLLRELHHRVKNNFQIILSLLSLQSRDMGDEKVTRAMRESQNRIRAMAFVHETMYSSADFARIDLESYVKYLATQLFAFYGVPPETISLILDIKNIFININTAIPLGLVINELVSNSLQHAFPEGRKGRITISILDDQKGLTLTFMDNGIGFSEGFDWKATKSLGFSLIRMLIDQLDGTIEREPSEGTLFIIRVMKKTDSHGRLHGTFNQVPE